GFDPDKLVRERGIDAFREKVGSAIDLVAFQYDVLRLQHDPATAAGRARIAGALMETVRIAVNPVLRDEYLRRSAEVSGIPEETLRLELKRLGKGRPALAGGGFPGAGSERGRSARPVHNPAERELVAMAVNSPRTGQALRKQIVPGDLQDDDCRELLQTVFNALAETDAVTTDMVMRRIERPAVADLLSEIALGGTPSDVTDQTIEQLVNKVREPKRKVRLKELKQRIDDAARGGSIDPMMIDEYQKLRATMRHWR
ncbi:MAG: hypothetical protein JW889_11290, partial [Verrucomicrobia bacterium]|nr:hypothetical protein [Verrucomicrobiota bacterium]